MRKYQQLLLLITSIVSVSLLLIYRHEYNRLRYVLEVFNFFGQPSDCSFPELLNITNTLQRDWGPTPIWISDKNFAIYSAFMKHENDIQIQALVVHEDTRNALHYCFLWFESNTKPVIGTVNYSKIAVLEAHTSFYKYNCHVGSVTETPYAISFADSSKISRNLKKIIVSPVAKRKHELTTICVIPSQEYSKQQIVEFISFYKIIGVDSFIIYNDNIPYKFMHLLQKLSLKLGVEIVNYPWNYPHTLEGQRLIIEEDCLQRTKDRSKNVITLSFNEFLVPKHHFTLQALLDSYDPSNRTNRFGLKILLFCADFSNKKRDREPAVLHNIYYDASNYVESIYVYRSNSVQTNSVVNTQEISDSVAVIQRYTSCEKQPKTTDSTVLRFAKDLRKSTLFKLFKYDRL